MLILGIDPGLAITGYGVIQKIGSKLKIITHGVITTSPKKSLSQRIHIIHKELISLLDQYDVEDVVVEDLFFQNNQKTALLVAQARGVVLNLIEMYQKNYFSYTPLQVKQGVSGYGGADKKQVQYMVKKLLNLREIPKPDDAADALAIAICHSQQVRLSKLVSI